MSAEGWEGLADQSLQAFGAWSGASRLIRRRLLEAWLEALAPVREPMALEMTRETGKPITLARGEVGRAEATLKATIDAVASFGAESIPYDLMAGADGCRATLRRFPLGPVLAITPFNFPVNLAMHKLAPALGVGCSVLWKPCPQAPRTSRLLWESFEAARLRVAAPDHLLQLADPDPVRAEALARDSRISAVSFTGSERVGRHLEQVLAGKRLLLELGGNGAVVVDEGVDAAAVAGHLAPAAVAGAGQSCSKAQRIYVHQRLWEAFVPAFVKAVQALPVGDPMDPATVVGPLIDEATAIRMDASLDRVVCAGASVLLRGVREGALLPPAILTGVREEDPLQGEEAFAPVTVLTRVATFDEGLDRAAATRFGLRASAYSRDQRHLRLAEAKLRAGGVLLNLPPTFRLDAAPFGGVGASGNGFEGPRWAMEGFTEGRLIVEGPAL
ncbi:MAG: aldehyde dehydrogenase family protein [Geothrix sp.]|jgi:acyl-CoA reductase-like NAD-dependent aldehyde dehydrogenase|uniref:Aldehyde dehydrogenase family protein n=1 Tax=Candidatus Geothrix odensensis TaxID=2954440 RepID=A0A936EZS8_9BACT|nr:aldehyde dehydrogenase family protein [Holophagaceae bacterium]MBK8571514.1 aldehyde dehydrogenase family protein [Candidatus Geothrix odensensis]MBK8788592.1 aldehyde dehydrogenase family protein [Holophagaceae bacterium]MBP7617849.1 aldehyde dehydrogenase family protein [Geothrix sp.]MCC6512957.1 aldehyde dehydrogenase family protein [Geothrix sp.]